MNILYGVPGEGMGHATRSKVVIDFLLKEHNVQVVSSAKAYQFLNKSFPERVHEIKGLHFAYKNAAVSKKGTFLLNLKSAPKNAVFNLSSYLKLHKQFQPDLIISDFESFTYFYAKYFDIPIISIDNMQVMNRCTLDIEVPKTEKQNYRLSKTIVKAKVPGCDYYFISSFFEAEIKKKRTELVPPIIRKAILNGKVSNGKHIIMYQTSSTLNNVKEILHQLPDIKFYVYGFGKDEHDKNVTFKSFSEQGFVDDLASARAVITNGGYSLISEAIYMKKPIYAFPIKNQFEQYMNAAYIDKLRYGRHFEDLSVDSLKAFLYDLENYSKHLSHYKQNGNKVLFDRLNGQLKMLKPSK
jgi:uncharacterized protein (TIGR00661 family)